MVKKINPSVQFNNITIKPDSLGYYKCPYNCNKNTGYPSPKWKTEKGILNHLSKCVKNPDNILKQAEIKNNIITTLEKLKEIYIPTLPYKIGDEISYIKKIIVEDTHKWNGFRYVKVRYEPIIQYRANTETINTINFYIPDHIPTIEELPRLLYFNNDISLCDIKPYDVAITKAQELTELDQKNRDFASFCR